MLAPARPLNQLVLEEGDIFDLELADVIGEPVGEFRGFGRETAGIDDNARIGEFGEALQFLDESGEAPSVASPSPPSTAGCGSSTNFQSPPSFHGPRMSSPFDILK